MANSQEEAGKKKYINLSGLQAFYDELPSKLTVDSALSASFALSASAAPLTPHDHDYKLSANTTAFDISGNIQLSAGNNIKLISAGTNSIGISAKDTLPNNNTIIITSGSSPSTSQTFTLDQNSDKSIYLGSMAFKDENEYITSAEGVTISKSLNELNSRVYNNEIDIEKLYEDKLDSTIFYQYTASADNNDIVVSEALNTLNGKINNIKTDIITLNTNKLDATKISGLLNSAQGVTISESINNLNDRIKSLEQQELPVHYDYLIVDQLSSSEIVGNISGSSTSSVCAYNTLNVDGVSGTDIINSAKSGQSAYNWIGNNSGKLADVSGITAIKTFNTIGGINAENSADSIGLSAGDNISITTANKTITISAKDTTYTSLNDINTEQYKALTGVSGVTSYFNNGSALSAIKATSATSAEILTNTAIKVNSAISADYSNEAGSATSASVLTNTAIKVASAISADYANSAGSASKLTASRTIAVSGDATWSVSFNGANNVTGNLKINSVPWSAISSHTAIVDSSTTNKFVTPKAVNDAITAAINVKASFIGPETALDDFQKPYDKTAIYLVGPIGTGVDRYNEYVVTGTAGTTADFLLIGDTSTDLSDYQKIANFESWTAARFDGNSAKWAKSATSATKAASLTNTAIKVNSSISADYATNAGTADYAVSASSAPFISHDHRYKISANTTGFYVSSNIQLSAGTNVGLVSAGTNSIGITAKDTTYTSLNGINSTEYNALTSTSANKRDPNDHQLSSHTNFSTYFNGTSANSALTSKSAFSAGSAAKAASATSASILTNTAIKVSSATSADLAISAYAAPFIEHDHNYVISANTTAFNISGNIQLSAGANIGLVSAGKNVIGITSKDTTANNNTITITTSTNPSTSQSFTLNQNSNKSIYFGTMAFKSSSDYITSAEGITISKSLNVLNSRTSNNEIDIVKLYEDKLDEDEFYTYVSSADGNDELIAEALNTLNGKISNVQSDIISLWTNKLNYTDTSGLLNSAQGVSISESLNDLNDRVESLENQELPLTYDYLLVNQLSGSELKYDTISGNLSGSAASAISAGNATNLGGIGASNYAQITGSYTANTGMKVYSAVTATNAGTATFANSAGSAAKLTAAKNIIISGNEIAWSVSFDGNANVGSSGQIKKVNASAITSVPSSAIGTVAWSSMSANTTGKFITANSATNITNAYNYGVDWNDGRNTIAKSLNELKSNINGLDDTINTLPTYEDLAQISQYVSTSVDWIINNTSGNSSKSALTSKSAMTAGTANYALNSTALGGQPSGYYMLSAEGVTVAQTLNVLNGKINNLQTDIATLNANKLDSTAKSGQLPSAQEITISESLNTLNNRVDSLENKELPLTYDYLQVSRISGAELYYTNISGNLYSGSITSVPSGSIKRVPWSAMSADTTGKYITASSATNITNAYNYGVDWNDGRNTVAKSLNELNSKINSINGTLDTLPTYNDLVQVQNYTSAAVNWVSSNTTGNSAKSAVSAGNSTNLAGTAGTNIINSAKSGWSAWSAVTANSAAWGGSDINVIQTPNTVATGDYPILAKVSTLTTTTTASTIFNANIAIIPVSSMIRATRFSITTAARMEYNSTTNSIDFIFN